MSEQSLSYLLNITKNKIKTAVDNLKNFTSLYVNISEDDCKQLINEIKVKNPGHYFISYDCLQILYNKDGTNQTFINIKIEWNKIGTSHIHQHHGVNKEHQSWIY